MTKERSGLREPAVLAALGAAFLFGLSTPIAKVFLKEVDPWMLAGLLYLGSGLGLSLTRLVRRSPSVKLPRAEWPWLAGAILFGGVVGPVLLLLGIRGMPASGASLLLNAESVFTALLALFVFKENFDRRIAWGMVAIVVGALILSWPEDARFSTVLPAVAVLGACLAWAIDNNLTRKVSLADATWIAALKGLTAGSVNLALALLQGAKWPSAGQLAAILAVGWIAYGISLVLFVVGLRGIGAARTGAYFSIAPFFGAAVAIPLLGESLGPRFLAAGACMGLGVWLHLTERHRHEHRHEVLGHDHEHIHDEHHQHEHLPSAPPGEKHAHPHLHDPLIHTHAHFPDAHHPHKH